MRQFIDGTATVNIGTGICSKTSSLTYRDYSGRYDCQCPDSGSLSLSPPQIPNCVLILDRPWYSSERVRRSEPYLWKPESVLLRSMSRSGINIDNAAEREHERYFYRFTRILINSSESIPIHPLSRASWTWTKIGLLKSPPLSQLKWSEISRYNIFFFFIGPWSNFSWLWQDLGNCISSRPVDGNFPSSNLSLVWTELIKILQFTITLSHFHFL